MKKADFIRIARYLLFLPKTENSCKTVRWPVFYLEPYGVRFYVKTNGKTMKTYSKYIEKTTKRL